MSFKYSVIGDNSPENREHLEKLGCDKLGAIRGKKYLVTDDGFYYASMVAVGYPVINCIGNPALFQAVTAMRDDNHIHQWHIIDYEVYLNMPKGYWFIATNLSGGKHVGCQIDPIYCHKSSLAELQEHFK